MFGDSNAKIGTREFFAIVFFTMGIKLGDTTPTLFLKAGKNAGWMVSLVSGIFTFIFLLIMLKLLKQYKNKGFMDIVNHLLGKKMNFVIGMVYFLLMIAFGAVNSRSYIDILADLFYQRTPIIILYVVLAASSYLITKHGFEGIGRTSYIMFPYVMLALVLFFILVLNQMHSEFLFPIAGPGTKAILKAGIIDSTIYADVVLIAVAFPFVKNYKNYKIASLLGLTLSVILVTISCAVYTMLFDYPPTIIVNYLFQTSARMIYIGRFVGNLEAFFLLFWIVGSMVRFSYFIYTSAAYLSHSLGLNELEHLFLPCAALMLIIGMIPENFMVNIEVGRKFLLNIAWILIYGLPLFLLIISKFKGGAKDEN